MNKKKSRIAVEIIISASLILGVYFFTTAKTKSPWPSRRITVDSGHRQTMGTFVRIVAVAMNEQVADKSIQTAFEQCQLVDNLMSDYKPDSELSRLNREAHKSAVKITKPTFEVLQKAIRFSELSEGAFDITIAPVVALWRKAADTNSLPTDAQLQLARSKVGYQKLILNQDKMTVRLAVKGMKLDLGGIAKGYAIDKATEAMQASGAIGGMVDIGGDIRCFGAPPPGKKTWMIGLQDPTLTDKLAPGKILLRLKLTDVAIATSGDYRRFALIEGKRYSHIIDTKTGLSSDQLSSVTVISDKAIDADALATAVTVMGTEKGLDLIEKIPQTEAILISPAPDYKITKTTGADKYIK